MTGAVFTAPAERIDHDRMVHAHIAAARELNVATSGSSVRGWQQGRTLGRRADRYWLRLRYHRAPDPPGVPPDVELAGGPRSELVAVCAIQQVVHRGDHPDLGAPLKLHAETLTSAPVSEEEG